MKPKIKSKWNPTIEGKNLEHQKFSGGGAPPWTVGNETKCFVIAKVFCGWIKDIVWYFVEL
jgi:hypothetical protein